MQYWSPLPQYQGIRKIFRSCQDQRVGDPPRRRQARLPHALSMRAGRAARTASLLREATGRSHESVSIVFVATPSPRLLPEQPRGAVGPEHINDGVTFFRYSPPRVLVWREEDADKVITHELVHRFGIDEALRLNTPIQLAARPVAKAFGLSGGVEVANSPMVCDATLSFSSAPFFAAASASSPSPASASP